MEHKKVYILPPKHKKVDMSQYTHIRVYHACRPTNINEYLENGIHGFSRDEAYNIAKQRLMQCDINEEDIKTVFDKMWKAPERSFSQICVNISKEELLNHSGHYLVYGSEFICGMAAQLFCQGKLKKIGVPTLFVCDVDITKVSPDVIECIETGCFYDDSWDGGIFLRGDVKPDEIVDYIQPKEMFDPLVWKNYRFN